jgi:glycosyltransferase involved in cell wall biosynthesis
MNEPKKNVRILVLDSGGGYGGPGAFLCYLLRYLDRTRFQPFAAFYFHHVAPETAALQRIGVPVFFLSQRHELANWLQVKFLPGRSRWRWLHLSKEALRFALGLLFIEIPQLRRLLRFLRQKRIDLIVLNNDVHFHPVGALAARISGIPCICRKAGGIGEGKRLKKVLTGWIDLFIAISGPTAKDQLENNSATKRMVSIYEGIDLEKFTVSSCHPETRSALGIPPEVKVVGYISRLVTGKGHNEFIEAAARIKERYQGVVFLIVGEDKAAKESTLMAELRSKVNKLGLADSVFFTGWRTDIPEILSILDVFVHCPTTWIEGLGIAHLEAMAMGKPTVVSDNGGLREAAIDGITGFVVPPGDIAELSAAVLKLLMNSELARQLGSNARKRTEEIFNAAENTRKLEAIFEEYASRHAKREENQVHHESGNKQRVVRDELSSRRRASTLRTILSLPFSGLSGRFGRPLRRRC